MASRTLAITDRLKKALDRKGPSYVLRKGIRKMAVNPVLEKYHRLRDGSFELQGERYDYFYHRFNETWSNARCVEIPVAKRHLEQEDGEVLEVGNVLPYYYETSHDVLDKYEEVDGVINEDIVEYKPGKKYDLIISVSTLEHVGYDYGEESDPDKIEDAVEHLEGLLAEDGKLIATIPIGYNPAMDELLENDELGFEKHYLKRVSKTEWKETSREDAENTEYGKPYPAANAVVVGLLEN